MPRAGAILLTLLIVIKLVIPPAKADLIWGVNGHPFTAYPGVGFEDQLDYVRDLGMTSYRVNISSIMSAPALQKLVDIAKPRGIDILPVLTPSLSLEKSSPEDLYKWAHAFAVYLVSRFKDDIRVWELGNELENFAIIQPCEMRDDGTQYNCDWGPAGGVGPLDYFGPRWAKVSAVLKGLSDGTKSVDPTIRKAIGTAGWGHLGAFERMKRDGIEWDISVWHMYGEDPEWAFKKLAEYGKPIWVTEFNHPYGSRDGVIEQAKGIKKWMARLRELQPAYRIEAAHIYELLDEPYWAPSFEAVMGLVRLDKDKNGGWKPGTPKPAYCAAKTFIRGAHAPMSRQCDLCFFDDQDASNKNKVAYSYCLILGRPADGAGLASWTARLARGASISGVLQAMIASEEFRARYAVSKLSDADYVTLIYRLLLGRAPDGQGHGQYVKRLAKGAISRADLAGEIINSDEFRSTRRILFQTGKAR